MRRLAPCLLPFLLVVGLLGCDGGPSDVDAGSDAGSDAGLVPTPDAGGGTDAGPMGTDSGTPGDDAGEPVDAGADGSDAGDGATPLDAGTDAGPEPCDAPGTLEDLPCGMCGTISRFCTSGRVWEYAECAGETGECLPGTTRMGSCGDCGTVREVCTAECGWEPMGACADEGECTPGALENRADGCTSGTRDFRCSDACVFEPVSDCASDPCPTPGVSEMVACGNCGTRTRFCTSANEWEYGPCGDEGECAPGTSRDQDCGRCGTQEERCNDACTWVEFGSCTDEGECSPGAMSTTTDGCTGGQQRPTLCSDACAYAPSGACVTPSGALGDGCTPGTCEAGLVCSEGTDVSICREPCETNTDCTSPRLCFTGDMVCSDVCTPFTDEGCPGGGKCDFLGYPDFFSDTPYLVCSGVGTLPPGATCTTNSQCQREHVCVLDGGGVTGRCTEFCDGDHACSSGTCQVSGIGPLGFCQDPT